MKKKIEKTENKTWKSVAIVYLLIQILLVVLSFFTPIVWYVLMSPSLVMVSLLVVGLLWTKK
jgi:VIT1/CCC1 family predicted Fe2+/Mn2+ transporter